VDLEHLQYYSPESIVVIARKMGLTVEHIETTGFPDFTAIESQPGRESLRGRLRAARTAVSGSPVGSVARAVRRAFPMSGHGPDRTNGTYHLFALLKRT
jgi:hypothetical protein